MNQELPSTSLLSDSAVSTDPQGATRRALIAFIVALTPVLYCFPHYALGHLKPVHVVFALLLVGLFFVSGATRTFLLLAIPFVLKDILFDALRYIPFEWYQPVHIEGPFRLDLTLFGISSQGTPMLFNVYLLRFLNPAFDLIGAIIYFLNEPVALLLIFLFWSLRSKELASRYSTAFLVMNLFAFLTYLFYPVAPPWYVAKFGLVQPLHPVLGDPAGLVGFDHIIHLPFAERIYNMNPAVFGAIPSMHAGFATLAWIYSFKTNWKWATLLGIYTFSMCFFALYLQHHYVIDLILGILYAVASYAVVEFLAAGGVGKIYRFLFRFFIQEGPRTLLG